MRVSDTLPYLHLHLHRSQLWAAYGLEAQSSERAHRSALPASTRPGTHYILSAWRQSCVLVRSLLVQRNTS